MRRQIRRRTLHETDVSRNSGDNGWVSGINYVGLLVLRDQRGEMTIDKDYRAMIEELRMLKMQEKEISHKLAGAVTSTPILMDALESGLIKLNFPAPSGFYRSLHSGKGVRR